MLHYVVAGGKGSKALQGTADGFISAFESTMSMLSDSLPDRMLLCACLGAFKHYDVIMREVKVRGLDDAIFATLEQVMQVQACITVL